MQRLVIIFIVLIWSISAAFAKSPETKSESSESGISVVKDSGIQDRKLPNGMRYILMQSDLPKGAISVRFILNVGNYDEAENEQGAAHFIEHLAFRSNSQFPDELPHKFFASLGVNFGSHLSAFTFLNQTSYNLDLPPTAALGLDRALKFLRGAADGITFTADRITTERGVIRDEYQARGSPSQQLSDEVSRFQSPVLRSFNRSQASALANLDKLTIPLLTAFYKRTYRPENATLIIVGSDKLDELDALVRSHFSSWLELSATIAPQQALQTTHQRGIEAFTKAGPVLPSGVSACRISDANPKLDDSLTRQRRKLASTLWKDILNARLALRLREPDSKMVSASMVVNNEFNDAKVACLLILPQDGNWKTALSVAQAEIRRFEAQGPTDQEREDIIGNNRSKFLRTIETAATRTSSELADVITQAVNAKRPYRSPREELRDFNLNAEQISVAEIITQFRRDWSGDGPLLAVSGEAVPLPKDLINAWNIGEKQDLLASYQDRAAKNWPYTIFGQAAKVIKRQSFTNPDFTRVTFSNGTILNVKPTDLKANSALLRISFGWGQEEIANAQGFLAGLGLGLIPEGGLLKLTTEEIGRIFTNESWRFQSALGPDAFTFSDGTTQDGLDSDLQIMTAFLQEAAFDPNFDTKMPTVLNYVFQLFESSPQLKTTNAINQVYFPNGMTSLPPQSIASSLISNDYRNLLKPILTSSPLEVTLVGKINIDQAIDSVARTLGAIPVRSRTKPLANAEAFRRWPVEIKAPIRVTHTGTKDQAAANMVWPLFVASPERRDEEYALLILSRIFNDRLLDKLRVAMGKSYTPTVSMTSIDGADQGQIEAVLTGAPEDIDLLVNTARDIAQDLAKGTISQADVDTARAPLLASHQERQLDNGYWVAILDMSSRSQDKIEEYRNYERLITSVSVDNVKKAATTWLSTVPVVAIATPAAGVVK